MRISKKLSDTGKYGAYFSLPGVASYIDPSEKGIHLYDVTDIKFFDWREPCAAIYLLKMAKLFCTPNYGFTARGANQIDTEIQAIEAGAKPRIGCLLTDETPIALAARDIGYAGFLVAEDDCSDVATTVFISELSKARLLDEKDKSVILKNMSK